jgi:hypothetical protein
MLELEYLGCDLGAAVVVQDPHPVLGGQHPVKRSGYMCLECGGASCGAFTQRARPGENWA